jgi:hypothetical protein
MIVPALVALGVWESYWWLVRKARRLDVYRRALATAQTLRRPLLVVGAPDHGMTGDYACGDMTTDIECGSSCPNFFQSDITKTIPLPDSSVVVFVSCVLEYVSNPALAIRELYRVSGGQVYAVGVEPWTLAGWLYPGTRTVDATHTYAGQR